MLQGRNPPVHLLTVGCFSHKLQGDLKWKLTTIPIALPSPSSRTSTILLGICFALQSFWSCVFGPIFEPLFTNLASPILGAFFPNWSSWNNTWLGLWMVSFLNNKQKRFWLWNLTLTALMQAWSQEGLINNQPERGKFLVLLQSIDFVSPVFHVQNKRGY